MNIWMNNLRRYQNIEYLYKNNVIFAPSLIHKLSTIKMQNLTRLVLRIHMKRGFSVILGVWICQKRREKKNQEFWYTLQFSCLQLVLFHTILGYLSIHKFNRFQGRRLPFMHPSAKASYSSPLHLVRGEWMNKKSGSALVWCYIASKSYHGKEWYEIGITLVILKAIGYNKGWYIHSSHISMGRQVRPFDTISAKSKRIPYTDLPLFAVFL